MMILTPAWSSVLTKVKKKTTQTSHCLCFTLLMWYWCTSQLYLEWVCVHVVNIFGLIWAVRPLRLLSIKHLHHIDIDNMQTKAAASSCCRLAVLMMSTSCHRDREVMVWRRSSVQDLVASDCWKLECPCFTATWQTQNLTCALCRY